MTHPYERMDCGHFARYEIRSEERSSCAICEIAQLKTENAMLREAPAAMCRLWVNVLSIRRGR